MAWRWPRARLAMAPAVDFPMPGRAMMSFMFVGNWHWCFSWMIWAVLCRLRALA